MGSIIIKIDVCTIYRWNSLVLFWLERRYGPMGCVMVWRDEDNYVGLPRVAVC